MILGVKDAAPWTDVLKVGLMPAPAMPNVGAQGYYVAGHAVPHAAVAQCSNHAEHLSSPADIGYNRPASVLNHHGPCICPGRCREPQDCMHAMQVCSCAGTVAMHAFLRLCCLKHHAPHTSAHHECSH
jgi:hypothetical protein